MGAAGGIRPRETGKGPRIRLGRAIWLNIQTNNASGGFSLQHTDTVLGLIESFVAHHEANHRVVANLDWLLISIESLSWLSRGRYASEVSLPDL